MNDFTLKAREVAAALNISTKRPGGWSAKFTKALSQVSDALQGVSDEQIEQEIAEYRRKRRPRKK